MFCPNKEKYKNAILYFVEHCNNDYLGETKLNKLMYYLDFIYYRDNKTSVTGDEYTCLPYGPVPDHLNSMISELKRENSLGIESVSIPNYDKNKVKYIKKAQANLEVFSSKEIKLLKNITKEFCNYSTNKIVMQTHVEAPWFYAELYDKIDFNYANDIDFFEKN